VTSDEAAYAALEREFSLFLRRARASAAELSREIHPDLDGSAYVLLSYVDQSGGIHAGDLAALFGVDKGAISRQVARLEAAGLLERRPDPSDGRARLLMVTEEGSRRLRAALASRQSRFRQRLRDWPRGDVERLAQLLSQLNASLDAGGPTSME
jgi:DNA-binding MarR family transcriptional regulator